MGSKTGGTRPLIRLPSDSRSVQVETPGEAPKISSTTPRGFFARIAPSLVGIIALALVSALWLVGDHSAYDRLLSLWGIRPFSFPFVDLSGSLAAWECARKGIDVVIADPCDVLNRGYNFSPFWMDIASIPLRQLQRVAVGLVLGVAFLVSLAALPPPLSRSEAALRIVATLSTMVVYAIERANPDQLIFILVIVALALLRRSLFARGLGYGFVFLWRSAIKYYPLIVLALVVKERLRVAIDRSFPRQSLGSRLFWRISPGPKSWKAILISRMAHAVRQCVCGDELLADRIGSNHRQHHDSTARRDHRCRCSSAMLVPILICGLVFAFGLRTTIPAQHYWRLDEARRLALTRRCAARDRLLLCRPEPWGYRGKFSCTAGFAWPVLRLGAP